MKIFTFDRCIEIYITNECNLTCSDCNRFNNYDFRGHYSWSQNSLAIQQWSQRIDAPLITIIGGEPSLHPELQQWVEGVASAWSHRPVMIQTNGLKPLPEFDWWWTTCKKFPNVGTGIAAHSEKIKTTVLKKWQGQGGHFDAWEFTESAIIDQGDSFRVHNSDPDVAFDCCNLKHCHTIFQGRLYKCPTVALIPEFSKQYKVEMSDDQTLELKQYKFLDWDCPDSELQQFVNDKDSPIAQCSICPSANTLNTVNFDPKRKTRSRISC